MRPLRKTLRPLRLNFTAKCTEENRKVRKEIPVGNPQPISLEIRSPDFLHPVLMQALWVSTRLTIIENLSPGTYTIYERIGQNRSGTIRFVKH